MKRHFINICSLIYYAGVIFLFFLITTINMGCPFSTYEEDPSECEAIEPKTVTINYQLQLVDQQNNAPLTNAKVEFHSFFYTYEFDILDKRCRGEKRSVENVVIFSDTEGRVSYSVSHVYVNRRDVSHLDVKVTYSGYSSARTNYTIGKEQNFERTFELLNLNNL